MYSNIGFFLPNHMKINLINNKLKYYCFLPVLLMAFIVSCEKQPISKDHKVDLFADERQEGKAYIMNADECYDGSDLVLTSSEMKLVDSSSSRGKAIFIYKVSSGTLLKTKTDSVMKYPFEFLSNQRLKLKKDSMYVFLKKLDGYRLIAEEKHLKYKWLKAAPVYSVSEEK
ncbi:hypothetical protein PMI13_01194 [Chryseobacterium populi]|uniref:Lipoprotein n=2 Tax=Chryseobacterium populi TaxID=1144316 RepID=J3CM67_9FLAO|nr:hypothetical protein PMI13_01194 [Chryseobacterium populi]